MEGLCFGGSHRPLFDTFVRIRVEEYCFLQTTLIDCTLFSLANKYLKAVWTSPFPSEKLLVIP